MIAPTLYFQEVVVPTELDNGTCEVYNKNPGARVTTNYREDGRKDY